MLWVFLMSSSNSPLKFHYIWNPTIFNVICWVGGSLGWTTHQPSVWCSKYYSFLIISCKIRCKNCFNLFFCKFTKINIKSFESIINYKKKCLEHQTLGWWVVRPIDQAYYIEDCRISRKLPGFAKFNKLPYPSCIGKFFLHYQ